jgi:hypothetical protein
MSDEFIGRKLQAIILAHYKLIEINTGGFPYIAINADGSIFAFKYCPRLLKNGNWWSSGPCGILHFRNLFVISKENRLTLYKWNPDVKQSDRIQDLIFDDVNVEYIIGGGAFSSECKTEDTVVDLIRSRGAVGRKKYGTSMDREDLTPAQWCQHLQEELADALQYVERVKQHLIKSASDNQK